MGASKKDSAKTEPEVPLLQELDEEAKLTKADKDAMARLGATLFDLIIHYMQTLSTVSRTPAAKRVWSDWQLPNWFSWFSMDLFALPIFHTPDFGLGIQTKMAALLLPLFALYYVQEILWSDSVTWRQLYVDEWATTKKKLSPSHPLVPVFPALTTGVAMSMAMLAFVVPMVTLTQAITTFLAFYFIQFVYGAVVGFAVGLAKVYYAEYRHETIDEDLPTEHIIDQRPDFFYGIRATGRQTAQAVLVLVYLPLCIAALHLVEEVRHLAAQPGAMPTCLVCNWYTEGIERYVVAGNLAKASSLLVFLTVGAPVFMYLTIRERRTHFNWQAAQKETQKGKWVWKTMPPRSETKDIFQLEEMALEMSSLGVPWFVRHPRIGQVFLCLKNKFLQPRQQKHGLSVRRTIESLEGRMKDEWLTGYEMFQRKQGEMGGSDSVWMCCSVHFIYWKIYTSFIEKYVLFALSSNVVSSLVNDRCESTFTEDFTASNQYIMMDGDGSWNGTEFGGFNTTDADVHAGVQAEWEEERWLRDELGLTGDSSAAGDGNWTRTMTDNERCERVTVIGMFMFCFIGFVLGLFLKPFLDTKQDKVDSACRFAGCATTFALVMAVYKAADDGTILMVVLIPNIGAITYALYIINPGEMAAAIGVEIRLFLQKRKDGKDKKEEQETMRNRNLFRAAHSGDFETLSLLIKKYDDTLNINYKYPKETGLSADGGDKADLYGLTAIHVAAAHGNLRCLRELLRFGLYRYKPDRHDVQWTDEDTDQVWKPVSNPLQLAWGNGCAQTVSLLIDAGFDLVDEDAGKKILKNRLVETLVPAGKHPERGADDLLWILGEGIAEAKSGKEEVIDVDTAVENAMAALVMRHEWQGLAEFMYATKRDKLELGGVHGMNVMRAVSSSCGPLLHMIHVENGTFATSSLVTIAMGEVPFSTLALVFHGALEAPEKVSEAGEKRELTMREKMHHMSNAATSFYIAGVSRFMKHALPTTYKYVSQAFLTDHSHNPTQWTLTFNTRGSMLDVFLTFTSRMHLPKSQQLPKFVMASMIITCQAVTTTNKTNISRPIQVINKAFERGREILVANFDVSKCQPDSGMELLEVRLSDIFVMDPIREMQSMEIVRMEDGAAVPGTQIAEWRLCGLPNVLPSGLGSSDELFLESNSMVTSHGNLRLGLHVAEIERDLVDTDKKVKIDDEWFHSRIQTLVGTDTQGQKVKGDAKEVNKARKDWKKASKKLKSGQLHTLVLKMGEKIELNEDGRVENLSDVTIKILSPMIAEALDLISANVHEVAFTENLSSNARKYIHIEANRRGLSHKSRTNKQTGQRRLVVSKPGEGVETNFPVNCFLGNVGNEPVDRQSFALRIEQEDTSGKTTSDAVDAPAQRIVLNHRYYTDVSLDEDSTHTFGYFNMATKEDFDVGDFPGSVVTIIRYQHDEDNHPPPKKKEKVGDLVEDGSPDESLVVTQLVALLALPPKTVPASFNPPTGAGIVEEMVAKGSIFQKKRGDKLGPVAGEHAGEFVLVMEGTAGTASGVAMSWDTGSSLGNLRDFLYGCGVNHEFSPVATSDCRIFVVRRSALMQGAGSGSPGPRAFSPPSYQELLPSVELNPRSTTVRWMLHGAPELLSGRSSLTSKPFYVEQTEYNGCIWRLHLIPRSNVGVFVSCINHDGLSSRQLQKGSYALSAQHDEGTIGVSKGQLAEGYPSRLAVFGDGSGGELGWGFSLTELWSDLMDNHTWEIECKLSIDPKHSTGLGVTALLDETKMVAGAALSLAAAVPGKSSKKKQKQTKSRQAKREVEFDENPLAD